MTVDPLLDIKSSTVGEALRLELAGWLALEFLDSRGLRLILHAYHRVTKAGSRFILVRPRPPADRVLRITGVEQCFWAVECLDEAVQLAAAADPQIDRGECGATRPLADQAPERRSPSSSGGAGT